MKALNNMKKRLDFSGGARQQSRMIEDKLKSLKKALLYSYQAGTMIISDESNQELEFRCLMNPDKLTFDADKKILSVPFADVCLNLPKVGKTSEGIINVPARCGKSYIWKETNTHWLILLQYIEELAYFRADVRKCFPHPMKINDKEYWFCSVGPNELSIDWKKKGYEVWNEPNYTRAIYIERNQETFDYFKRFKKIKLPNIEGELKTWEVQAVSSNVVDDILIIHVKEYFENEFEEVSAQEQEKIQVTEELKESVFVHVYDKLITDKLPIIENAVWEIRNKSDGLNMKIDALLNNEDNTTAAVIQLMNGKTGEFDVYYNATLVVHVVVKSI